MKLRPICEPVDLPPGTSILAEHVVHPREAPASARLMHFHDVCEIVLFDRVAGSFIAGGRRYPLHDGSVVFVPSMHHHDFELGDGAKAWTLIQIDPYLVERLARQPALARLGGPLCAHPDGAAHRRLALLADWLVEANAGPGADTLVPRLVELLLIALAAGPAIAGAAADAEAAHVERLLPALEALRRDARSPASMAAAASACHLSPAHFSRRFRQVFGMTFSDYSRAYRLHLAARRLVAGGDPIAEIAYATGFASPAHFTAAFRTRFGVTPRAYRRGAPPPH